MPFPVHGTVGCMPSRWYWDRRVFVSLCQAVREAREILIRGVSEAFGAKLLVHASNIVCSSDVLV